MRQTISTWLLLFAGSVAATTGLGGVVNLPSPWSRAATDDLAAAWSQASVDMLLKHGGLGFGIKSEVSAYNICQTNIKRDCGGHCCYCQKYGTKLLTVASSFNYAKSTTVQCGPEIQYTFANCTGEFQMNAVCGAMSFTDYYDP